MIKDLNELKDLIEKNNGYKFQIKVVANSKINLLDFCEEYIKVKITQRAIEGKANKAIIEFFAQELKCQKSKIAIVIGEKSSIKTIKVSV